MDDKRYLAIRKIMKEENVGFTRAEEIYEEKQFPETMKHFFKKTSKSSLK